MSKPIFKLDLEQGAVITPDRLRRFIVDNDADNAPLYEQELTDEDLWEAIEWAVDDFNETPPLIGRLFFDKYNFPFRALLLIGSAGEAMRQAAFKHQRREMTYNDGGITSSIWYKAPQFLQLKTDLAQTWDKRKGTLKRQLNAQQCYGGMNGEWWFDMY